MLVLNVRGRCQVSEFLRCVLNEENNWLLRKESLTLPAEAPSPAPLGHGLTGGIRGRAAWGISVEVLTPRRWPGFWLFNLSSCHLPLLPLWGWDERSEIYIKEYSFHFLIKHLVWFQHTRLQFTCTEKMSEKWLKKKIKLRDYILTYKRLLLILCSAEKKKNKKFLLEGPDGVHRVSSWNVDISWPPSVKISAMDHRNTQHYCGFWFFLMFLFLHIFKNV